MRILVVMPHANRRERFGTWLANAGYEVLLVPTFSAARSELKAAPDILVSDVKLGVYNGLHLAMHARRVGVPAILLGTDDPVLARDAAAIDARWLGAEPDLETVVGVVRELIGPGGISARGVSEIPERGQMSWWGVTGAEIITGFRSRGDSPLLAARMTRH